MRLRGQKAQLRVNQRADLAASTREADVTARVGGVLMRALRTPGPAVSALRVGLVCVCVQRVRVKRTLCSPVLVLRLTYN